jgi:hypothetical protein
MHCPRCSTTRGGVVSAYRGQATHGQPVPLTPEPHEHGTLVFVDVCIDCRGVWLDGGELETLGG